MAKLSMSSRMVEETFESMQHRIATLEEKDARQSEEIVVLRKELEQMRNKERDLLLRVEQFESANLELPLPMWFKDLEGRMLFVNSFFEREMLLPRGFSAKSLVGNYDSAVWDEETARRNEHHDALVRANRVPWEGVEIFPDIHGILRRWIVVRYPRFISSGIMVGVAGVAIPERHAEMMANYIQEQRD